MKKITFLLSFVAIFLFNHFSFSQVTMSTNDMVVLQVNTDGGSDEVAFLVLGEISAGSKLFFSDISWNAIGGTQGSDLERGIKLTVGASPITAGTIIRIKNDTGELYELEVPAQGTLEFYELDGSVETGASRELTLATNGDQLVVFQTSDGVVTSMRTFIYALNLYAPLANDADSDGWTDSGSALADTDNDSHVPTGLTALNSTQSNKTTASAMSLGGLSGHLDNWIYTGATTAASKNEWLTRVHTLSNWSGADDSPPGPYSGITYDNVALAGNAASVVVSATIAEGDLAIVRYNSDGTDDFSIIAVEDIPASSTVFLTDYGWLTNGSGFTTNSIADGTITWTSPASTLTAGSIIHFIDTQTDGGGITVTKEGGGSAGSVSGGFGSTGLSGSGETIIIYTTATNVATATPTFIYALKNRTSTPDTTPVDGWKDSFTGTSTLDSGIPGQGGGGNNTLTAVTVSGGQGSAFGLLTHVDNYVYQGSLDVSNRTTFFSNLHNTSSWASDNVTAKTTTEIGPSNAAPTASSFVANVTGGTVYAFATANFGYSDGDSDPLNSIRIDAVPNNGVLFNDANSNSVFDCGEGFIDDGETISKADLDAGKLKYASAGSTNSSFTFSVNDGTEYSATNYTTTLTVSGTTTTQDFSSAGLANNVDSGSGTLTSGNYRFIYSGANIFGRNLGAGDSMGIWLAAFSGSETLTVETVDGSEFDLQSFFVRIYSFNGSSTFNLEGFKNAASVGSQSISVCGSTPNGEENYISPNTTFDDVDRVVLTSTGVGFFDIFDDFVFGTAIPSDTTAPSISSVSLASDNSYIDVTFTEGVFDTNGGSGALETTDFSLSITGGTATSPSVTSVTTTGGAGLSGGETTVRVNFGVTGSISGAETLEVDLGSNAVFDAAGNAAAANQTSNNTASMNDATGPTVTNVSSSTADGIYKVGDAVVVTVTFSEAVTVSGTPQLTLETGTTDRTINYNGTGSGTTTLEFTYTVQAGDTSADLDYVANNSLTVGTSIQDAANNDATLTLASPGAAGSLGNNKALVLDTSAPVFSAVSPSSSSTVNNANVGYTLSEAITSGSVTYTRTGGTADGSSPHVVALTGTELNAGIRALSALTNAPTLVNGTIYTISFNASDAGGNTATTVSSTSVTFDTSAPSGYSATIDQSAINSINVTAVSFTFSGAEVGTTYNWAITSTGGGFPVFDSGTIATTTDNISVGDLSSLGDGTITLTVRLVDAAGNEGPEVNAITVVKETTVPVISAVSPSSISTVSTANVGYTLSEAITSGSVTYTRTGGTVDISSPHVSGLTGTELNSGTRALAALTNAPTLLTGAIYTISFNATDAVGNIATTVSSTSVTYIEIIPLTITGLTGSDKVYDDSTTGSATGTATLSGVLGGDDVTISGSPVYTFASANVGTGITLNTTGYTISGTDAGKYLLTQPTLSADITAKGLTITNLTGDDKVYDDGTVGSASGVAMLSGVEAGDGVTLGGSPVYTFASANVGTGITLNTIGYTISGTDSGNYTLTQPTLSADITAKGLTITGLTGTDKIYDDSTTGSASGTVILNGLEAGDDVTLGGSPVYTFASANVGTGITLNTTGYTISGTDSGNYTLTQPTLSADITAKGVTVTGLTGSDKVYDDSTTGSATGTPSLVGVESGDDVSLTGSPMYTFASANVGTGITINTIGFLISGTDSGNYTLTQPTLSGDITDKELTITGLTGQDKIFDGNNTATVSGTPVLSGLESGDDVSLGGSPVYTFTSNGPGTAIAINTTGYTISGTDSGNYTITQPTLSADITLPLASFTSASSSGLESVSSANLSVDLSTAYGSIITVDYTVTGTATGGGTDYTLANGILTFNPGSINENITIASIIDDAILEANETVIVTLSNPVNADLGTNTIHTYTITNNDAAAVTISDISGAENGGLITVTATLDNAVQGGFTVDVSTVDGTATTANSDYIAVTSQTLTFTGNAGETQIFTVTPIDDTTVEADETLTISQSNLSATTLSIDITDGATGTILNDDAAAVTISDVSATENGGAITVTAILDNGVQGGFTVDVSTADGTATTADSDYSAVTAQTITFTGTAGEMQTFTITPTADLKLETNETLTVSQNNLDATSLAVDITDGATVTIINDDTASVTISDVSANEDDGSITITTVLDNPVQGGFSVDVNSVDGTATIADGDYTPVTGQTLTFVGTAGEMQTFTITPTVDTKLESNETIMINQSNLAGTTLGVMITDTAVITINNDDAAAVTIADVNINENDGAVTLTATLDNAVQGGFTVNVNTSDGTATIADSDYTSVTGQTLTFVGTSGEMHTFTVTPTPDTKLESNETVAISQSSLGATTLGVDITDSATVTIDNDDATMITLADITVDENQGIINVVATLGNAVQDGFILNATTLDGTAVAPGDFTALVNQPIPFIGTAGETQNIALTITDDSVGEETEMLTMIQSSISGTTLGGDITITDTATVTIIDDDAPVVTMVSVPADGNYGIGDHLDFTVSFTNAATISGSPSIPITIGSVTRQAVVNGTFTGSLTADFRYTIVEGDEDMDGITVGSDILLNGGTIVGSTNIDAILTLNNVASTANVNVDGIKPTVVITTNAPDPTNTSFTATFTFSEDVTGFELTDIIVGNGAASSFATTSATVYTATVTPTADGNVTIDVNADVAFDAVSNPNIAASQYSVLYDATRPTLTITSPAPDPTNMDFTVTFTFSEPVLNFEMADLVVDNGTPSAFTTIDSQTYTALISPTVTGGVIVLVPDNVAEDPATNGNVVAEFGIEFDNTPPDIPYLSHISEYTCTGNVLKTGDNTLEISGSAEPLSIVEVFIGGTSIGTIAATNSGFFTFDHTGTTLADGVYDITVTATDAATNTSPISNTLTIEIDSLDSDGDGLPDFCDDDVDGNGVTDTDEDCDGDGIIDSLDTDNSACTTGIQNTKTYGFSPNGDGVNDGWYIDGISAYPNSVVQVFNRSGKLVFKKKGYQNDWTAVSNQISNSGSSNKLPVGPYLFIIDLGDGSKPTRGWLYINY